MCMLMDGIGFLEEVFEVLFFRTLIWILNNRKYFSSEKGFVPPSIDSRVQLMEESVVCSHTTT